MGLAGTVKNFRHKYKFRVEIDGFASADFSKVDGLEVEIKKVEHREGGSLVPNKSAGLVDFSALTLERGRTGNIDFFNWLTASVSLAAAGVGATNTGAPTPVYKRNLDIVQMDADGSVVERWTVYGAWVSKYKPGDWGGDQNEVVLEMVTLEYDFFDKTL